MAGTLFVVATPIGNLEDISARALRVLREVSLIAAEDTRHTGHLLQRFGLTTRTTSFHEHSEKGKAAELVERLRRGESVALVSDAGTPTISDPGVQLVRLAREAGQGTVGTVGEIEVDPCLINAVAEQVRFSLDIRGPVEDAYRGVAREIGAFAEQAAAARGMSAEYRERQTIPPTPMDDRIVGALETAAEATGEPYRRMHSGAAHDTMCVADRVPTAMVFVPCKDGISHHPAEDANPADAALAAGIILEAIRNLV